MRERSSLLLLDSIVIGVAGRRGGLSSNKVELCEEAREVGAEVEECLKLHVGIQYLSEQTLVRR